jgi:hypothetical protein
MSYVVIRRALPLRRVRNLWSGVAGGAAATLLCCAPQGASAQMEADFEKPPVLQAQELVSKELLTGKGVRIEDQVPTDGVMGALAPPPSSTGS